MIHIKIRGTRYCPGITNIQYLLLIRVAAICALTAKAVSVCAVSHCTFQLRKASQSTKTQVSPAPTCSRTFAVVFTKVLVSGALKAALLLTALARGKRFPKLPMADMTGGKFQNPRSKCMRFFILCGKSMKWSGI